MIPAEIRDRIRAGLEPTLLAQGFRGRSSTFSREVADLVHLLQLQAAPDNSSRSARFTVNVAVWVPALAAEPRPSVADAHWQVRLGQLEPGQSDQWWQADDETMADDTARELALRIEKYAVPALERFRSSRDLLALWRAGSSPGLTALQADRFRRRLERRG